MSIASQIEDIWITHTTELVPDVLVKTLSYEPDKLDRLNMPLLTMWYMLPAGVSVETGDGEEVDHRWAIYLYVKLANWKDAQAQMRDTAWEVVQNFRRHRLDYSDAAIGIYARTLSRLNPPMPGAEGAWLRGSWELRVTANEF